jgi:hypothetical protein
MCISVCGMHVHVCLCWEAFLTLLRADSPFHPRTAHLCPLCLCLPLPCSLPAPLPLPVSPLPYSPLPPPPSSPLPWCTQQYSFVNSAWTWFLWCFDKNGNSDHNCREWWGEGDLGRGASQTQEAWHSFFFQMCLDRRIRSQALPCCLAMVAELAASFSVQGTK